MLLDVLGGPIAKGLAHELKTSLSFRVGDTRNATHIRSGYNETIPMTDTSATMTSNVAAPVVEGLNTLLADSYALMGQTHFAHWNVEGSDFFQLHTAFQAQYEELFTAIDEIAERLRALDSIAPGGLATLAEHSQIEELAVDSHPAKDFVAHLVESHEVVVSHAHELRNAAEQAGDLETQDLVIARIKVHQKTLWMLRSFLKNR